MKVKNFLYTALCVVLCSNHILANDDDDAVARIYATTSMGNVQSGTGFFVKVNNQLYICTAYHVISGTHSLEIKSADGDLVNFSIAAYDEQKDLALINFKSTKSTSHIRYFNLVDRLPDNMTDLPGYIIGHPITLTYSHSPVSFTNNKYITSDQIDCFRIGLDLNLIGINAIIYDGESGAPVITAKGVVGLISGSYNEGGTITWAIPAYYIVRMHILSSPVVNLNNLPPLNIFSKPVRKLTRSFDVNVSAQVPYHSFLSLNANFKSHNNEFESSLNQLLNICKYFKNSLDGCDTYEKWHTQYKNFTDGFNSIKSQIEVYLERNHEDIQTWTQTLDNLRQNLNDDQFSNYMSESGKFIDTETSSIKLKLLSDERDQQRIVNEGQPIIAALQDADNRNDYSALHAISYNWIDNIAAGYGYIRNSLHLQNQMIEVNEILENAMVECQKYR